MSQVKTTLVSRNKLFSQGLRSLLGGSQFTVVCEADDIGRLEEIRDEAPASDLILLDNSGDLEQVIDELERLTALVGDTPIVVLTEGMNVKNLIACLVAGASGYLVKDISVDVLLQSLRLVMLGEKVLPTQLAAYLIAGTSGESLQTSPLTSSFGLSDREAQILRCLIDGDSNKVMAKRLNITEATVKVHMKALLRKIKASNRTQAAIWGLNHGFKPPDETVVSG